MRFIDMLSFFLKKASLLVLLIIFIERAYEILGKFSQHPTYFDIHFVPQYHASFPALTVCSLKGYKLEVLQDHGVNKIKQYNGYEERKNLLWKSNSTNLTEQQLFDEVTYRFEEIVGYIQIRSHKNKESNENKIYYNSSEYWNSSIKEHRHRKYGKCYVFMPEKHILQRGVYYIWIKFKKNARVFYHGQNDFLMFPGRMGHDIYKGKKIQTEVRVQEVRQVSRYISVGNDYRGLDENKMITCKNHKYDDCMYKTLTRMMQLATEDNCTVPWILNNDRICQKSKDIEIAFKTHWNNFLNQKNICESPCHKVVVDIHGKNVVEQNNTHGDLWSYFSYDVAKGEEHMLYTGINVAAEIGGYLGLLLGYSLYHFAQTIEAMLEKKIVNWKSKTNSD